MNKRSSPFVRDIPFDQRHIGAETRMISNMIYRIFNCPRNDDDDDDTIVTGGNGWILGYLAQNEDKDVFQRDIEEQFQVRRATVSKMIRLMEQKGLVERRAVPYDARLKKLALTQKGRRHNERMLAEFERVETLIKKDIPTEKLYAFFEVCDLIKGNILNINMREDNEE